MLATNKLRPSRPRLASAVSSRACLLFATATDTVGSFLGVDGWRRRSGRCRNDIGAGGAGLVFGGGGDLRPIEAENGRARSPERPKSSAFQSISILRLPTPRNPP